MGEIEAAEKRLESWVGAEGVPVPGDSEMGGGSFVGIDGPFEPGQSKIVLAGVGVEAGNADAGDMGMLGTCGEHVARALHGFAVARSGKTGMERVDGFVIRQYFKEADGFRIGFLVHVLFEVGTPEAQVGGREIGIRSENVLEIFDGLIVTAKVDEVPAVEGAPKIVHGVESKALVDLDVPFGVAMEGDQKVRVHKVSDGAAGINLDGALKVALGRGPVMVKLERNVGETDVRLGERRIEFKRFEGVGFGFIENFRGSEIASIGAHEPDIGETGIGEGEVGIFFESKLEVAFGFFNAGLGKLEIVGSPFKVGLIGFRVDGAR